MSYYAMRDGNHDELTEIATIKGWGEFTRWASKLADEDFGELIHLCEYGWSQETTHLKEQLQTALQDHAPDDADIEDIGGALLSGIGGSVVTITDGMMPDEEESPARALLADACRRVVRRIGTHARRVAEKHPGAFLRFLDDIEKEHAFAIADILRPHAASSGGFVAALRHSLLEASGRCTAPHLAAEVARAIDAWENYSYEQFAAILRCGGEGSGVPGPCPEGADKEGDKKDEKTETVEKSPAEKQKKLEEDIKVLEKTKEGKETIEKGAKLADKVKSGIASGVKKALDAIDDESKGGVSLIAGGLKNTDVKAVAFGTAQLVSSVFKCVHEEVFELGLSQATGAPAFVGKTIAKIGSKALGTAEANTLKAVAYAWGKATGTRSMRQFRADLSTQDKELLAALAQVGGDALKEVLAQAGVEDVEIDTEALKEAILDNIEGK